MEAQRKDISACLARQDGTATLSWPHLTVTVTDGKGNERQILKGIDVYIKPNHMLVRAGGPWVVEGRRVHARRIVYAGD